MVDIASAVVQEFSALTHSNHHRPSRNSVAQVEVDGLALASEKFSAVRPLHLPGHSFAAEAETAVVERDWPLQVVASAHMYLSYPLSSMGLAE